MPHIRERHLLEPFKKLIRNARIVGILGHRQVGKTTLLQSVAKEYVTLDDEDTYIAAKTSPKKFIASLTANLSGIDECQLVPGLFPAVKVRVGTSAIPGRFILSGSVRFTSRRAIRESLTGRISNIELYPFVLTELNETPNSSFLLKALQIKNIDHLANDAQQAQSQHNNRSKLLLKYLSQGGLPGLFHLRDLATQQNLLRNLMETILDRDLRLVYNTTLPYQRILEYCQMLAQAPLEIVRPSTLKKSLRIAESTQKNLLHALESVFLIRRIPVEGDFKGDLFWFEDQIERNYFARQPAWDESDWTTLVYRNARAQFNYQVGEASHFFCYRTRGGASVPLGIRTSNGALGMIPVKSQSDINTSLKRSAESFLKRYNHSKVLFLTREGKTFDTINDRIAIVPAQVALF